MPILRQGLDWLDSRTGHRALLRNALYEPIPGGARWRYVWGSALAFTLFVQLVTGLALWAGYSANAQGAWESVYFIQHRVTGGWILRGIHHYTTQVMIVLLVLHLMQVLIAGAYRAPREVTFWLGLCLLFVVMALGLTGYLLPWDQKGYWATKVATSIASMTPIAGPSLQRVLLGGAEYGHHTLTRFFALHAGVLPLILLALLVGHVYLFRRHGVTPDPKDAHREDGWFWPEQALRDGVASLAVMAVVMGLVLWTHGAHLGAPADPTEPYAAARPDWYFMFLFEWLKHFPAGFEVLGAQLIPGMIVLLVAAMPLIGRWRLGHRFNLGVVLSLIAGVGLLTRMAYVSDARDPVYRAALEEAEALADRVRVLAEAPGGIPPTGALSLLREDPLTQGPRLFAESCSGCHRYDGHDGLGTIPGDEPRASDLAGYGSREWLSGLLDPRRVGTPEYFGATAHASGRMVRFVQRGIAGFDAARAADLTNVIAAVAAEAALPERGRADPASRAEIAAGRAAFAEDEVGCARCHTFREYTDNDIGPVLTGWASRAWILGMLHDPSAEAYYGADNDGMPAFGREGRLTDKQMELIADWLRRDWYEAGDEEPR